LAYLFLVHVLQEAARKQLGKRYHSIEAADQSRISSAI
jgi:hypothetical protein